MKPSTALAIAKSVAREPYAWPGGYARFLITEDGGVLCPACVRSEFSQIARYTIWQQRNSGWMAAGASHTGQEDIEETECCDHCGKLISEL